MTSTGAPARIWAGKNHLGYSYWSENVAYVRADIVAELVAALEVAQWSERWDEDAGREYRRCPVCAAAPNRNGHRPDCAIGRALALARNEEPHG